MEEKRIRIERVNTQVFCPICTRLAAAEVDIAGKRYRVVPGQRCPRCAASLDPARVLDATNAAGR